MREHTAGRYCTRSSSSSSRPSLRAFRAALLLLAACGLLTACQAYPQLFEGSDCTSHPTRARGEHAAPIPDTTTTFTLSKSGSSKPETAVCPGVTYNLILNFGGERRRALLTASSGEFGSPGSLPADPKCPNRAASAASGPTYSNTLTLPCDAKGPQLLLNATSAARAADHFHVASTTLPVSPVSTCPDSTCPGAAPAAQAAPAAAAVKPAGATPAPDATPAAVRAGPAQASRGSSCAASAYGYACAVDARDGATLHFTMSDSPTPPDNLCTATAQAPAVTASSSDGLPQQYLHLLLESPAAGYSGVGFPQTYGKMYPADAVIGYVDSATGKPVVSAYHLTDLSPTQSATNSNGLGWASHLGAAIAKPAGSSGRSLLCFSRPVNAPQAAVAKQLDPSALTLNWVGDSSTSFDKQHSLTHSMTLNAAGGTVSSSSSADSKLAAQLAHGALMLLAFTAFMPLGALMARHKWVLGDDTAGGIRPGWFHMHRAVQTLGLLLAVAGFILALVSFAVPWSNMGSVSTPHELYNPHRVLGVIVMALSVLQALGGALRPSLAHKRRLNWRKGHMLMGWLTLAAGVAVVLMGAVMMHDIAGAPYVSWLLPILLFLGLLLAAGAVGEVFKAKLERKGAYDPKTHAFAPSGTISARSSGTGTPDAEVSSRAGGPFAGGKHDAAVL